MWFLEVVVVVVLRQLLVSPVPPLLPMVRAVVDVAFVVVVLVGNKNSLAFSLR
jgi:hypothetical protein